MKSHKDAKENAGWIDVSVGIESNMVHWPGDPPVIIDRIKDMGKGDNDNVSKISLGSHTGTHMDAPLHFFQRGMSLDKIPLDAVIGHARVIEIEDKESIKPAELKNHNIGKGERILFKTVNSTHCWNSSQFVKDFVYISHEAAIFLAECSVITIGIDYLSVGGYLKDGAETHRTLLGAGIWIIEGLNLSKVKQGEYDLICLPMKILNADGAPARAVLRPLNKN